MNGDDFRFLASPEGEEAIRDAASCPDPLSALTRLRRRMSPEKAAAVLLVSGLRERAKAKFSRAGQMLFTRESLEMATGERMAEWRARRFRGCSVVADLTCGIGGDALALAAISPVIAVDRDPILLRMARHNTVAYGFGERFHPVCADVTAWRPPADAVVIDPARRLDGRRTRREEEMQPPLALAVEWARAAAMAAIKVSPAAPWESWRDRPGAPEIEWVSERGECREAVLWWGEARTCAIRASLADAGASMVDHGAEPAPVRGVGAYLHEPDAALRRAHLVDQLAGEIGAWKLDPGIAYLSSDEPVETPFAVTYEVEEEMAFSLKALRSRLLRRGTGRVVIKKRGVAYDPAEIERRLRLPGGEPEATVALTRIKGRSMALIVRRIACNSS